MRKKPHQNGVVVHKRKVKKLEWTTNTPKRGGVVYLTLGTPLLSNTPAKTMSRHHSLRFLPIKGLIQFANLEIQKWFYNKNTGNHPATIFPGCLLQPSSIANIHVRYSSGNGTFRVRKNPLPNLAGSVCHMQWFYEILCQKRIFALQFHIQLEVHLSNDKQLFNLFPGSTQKKPEGLVCEVLCQYRSTCAAVERNKRPHHNLLPLS